MSTYIIGDVQGCCDSLTKLLKKVNFDRQHDQLWFAGDLINRGPKSLQTLRLIVSLGSAATTVLGNHDLHALAIYYGNMPVKSKDTLTDLFAAKDSPKLMEWLCNQPLAIYDDQHDLFLSHAGIPPKWSIKQALKYALEVEEAINSKNAAEFFTSMYGNQPDRWTKKLKGKERLRVITNYFTRMRFIDEKSRLDLKSKLSIDTAPAGFDAWFNYARKEKTTFVFGHWAALQGVTEKKQFIGLDTGCVWGGVLRALHVETGKLYEVSACD